MRSWNFLILAVLVLSSCASYQSKVAESKDLLRKRNFEAAVEKLEPLAKKESKDQLIYLLDYAMSLHLAGKYKESAQQFLAAEDLAEIKDYTSISAVAESTLGSEEMVQYKGESYERMLIPFYLGLNFLMLHDFDNAMVSVRKLNNLVERYRTEAKKDYANIYFAEYLAALLREEARDFDNALITLERAYKLDSNGPYIHQDLLRLSRRAQRRDKLEKYVSQFGGEKEDKSWSDPKKGELVVILQQGWGPQKVYSKQSFRFPALISVNTNTTSAQILINGVTVGTTQLAYDLSSVAIKTFNDDWGPLIARRIASDIAKRVAANAIGKNNKTLGDLAYIAMAISDRADLRQWSTLPQTFQLARVMLEPGTYRLKIQGQTGGNYPSSESSEEVEIQIQQGKRNYFTWRSMN